MVGFPSLLRQVLAGALVLGAAVHAQAGDLSSDALFPRIEDAETPNLFPMAPCGTFKLEEATIDEMQQAMAAGTLTSVQLVHCYLQRTYQTNGYIK